MKKFVSMLMALLLIFSIIPTSVFAIENDSFGGIDVSQYTNSELDLTKYTMDDIVNMTSKEYLNLVAEFERVYDPYNSYVSPEDGIELGNTQASEGTIDLQWTSGKISNGEWTETGTHEYITSAACLILSNNKGFFTNDATAAVVVMLSISLASLLPDKDERWDGGLFAAHFYNPNTEKNYLNSTSQTAKTKAISHFNSATTAAANGNMETAYEHIGRCLHYIQDANEPHHAANKVSNGANSHAQFEQYAEDNMEEFLKNYTSISSSCYTYAVNNSIGTIVKAGAKSAYALIGDCDSIFDKSKWESCAKTTLKSATKYSAEVLYKFSRYSGVPFVRN